MEADRARREQLLDYGGQQVLAGVLLHVIEAARPVDEAVHDRAHLRGNAADHVHHVAHVVVLHLDDRCAGEGAEVVWLSAGGWVERRAIEPDRRVRAARLRPHDRRIKRRCGWLAVIQAVGRGHGAAPYYLTSAGSGIPASANPRARNTQLSHRPQAWPFSPGL